MKLRVSLALGWAALLCAGLACQQANVISDPAPLRIEWVVVTPFEGSGAFSASVGAVEHTREGTLLCYIPGTANEWTNPVYKSTLAPSANDIVVTFSFNKTEPGSYQLYCTAMEAGITEKASFQVLEPTPTATPEAGEPPAPTNTPEAPPSGVTPQSISGTGTKFSFYQQYSCPSVQQVILRIRADGTAELSATGPSFIDHINCTQSGQETWSLEGTVNPQNETVTFSTCNSGGFSARGSVKYAGGTLSGEASCVYIQGSSSGETAMRLTMP